MESSETLEECTLNLYPKKVMLPDRYNKTKSALENGSYRLIVHPSFRIDFENFAQKILQEK